MVLVVVEPEDHGGVLGKADQKFLVVAHSVVAEHLNLLEHLRRVVHLGVARGEDHVPEEGHLLHQRARRGVQVVHEVGRAHSGGRRHLHVREIASQSQLVVLRHAVGVRVHQFFHGGFVTLCGSSFELVVSGSETGAAHEVGHQCNVLVCHSATPFFKLRAPLKAHGFRRGHLEVRQL